MVMGDAAHTRTPAAGAGIKYAVEDAVVAANVLAKPLKAGQVRLRQLAAVQRQREIPTRFIQAMGAFAQKNFLRPLLTSQGALRPPPSFLLAPLPALPNTFPR